MSLRKSLSDVVREAKRQSGMTYDEIVEKVGCSKSSVRYALNGGDKVGIDIMERIITCCGFSAKIDSLYGSDDYDDVED